MYIITVASNSLILAVKHYFVQFRVIFSSRCTILLFLKGQTRPLFHLFWSFQTHITIIATNKCEKMSIQYTLLGFELTTFGT